MLLRLLSLVSSIALRHPLIPASIVFLLLCVRLCVHAQLNVRTSPQLCLPLCLCSRDLGLFHSAYLCQLGLVKPGQAGVHTGDITHSNTHSWANEYHTCHAVQAKAISRKNTRASSVFFLFNSRCYLFSLEVICSACLCLTLIVITSLNRTEMSESAGSLGVLCMASIGVCARFFFYMLTFEPSSYEMARRDSTVWADALRQLNNLQQRLKAWPLESVFLQVSRFVRSRRNKTDSLRFSRKSAGFRKNC